MVMDAVENNEVESRKLRINLTILATIFTIVFSCLAILRHARLNSAVYDLGLFDQIIYNLAHFRFFESSIKGFNYLGDHFSPILILFTPLYWIKEDVRLLLIAQSLIISLSGYYAGMLSYHFTKDRIVSTAFGLAILLNSNVMLITQFDFHPETMSIPLFIYIIYQFALGRTDKVFIASAIALTIKEDVAITVALSGIVFYLMSHKRVYLLLTLIGAVYFFLVIKLFIPCFRPKSFSGDYLYIERYSYLGRNMKEVIISILSNPFYPLFKMFNWTKLKVLLRLLYPTLFLSLLSPKFLIVILPIMYINWIPDYPPQFSLKFQYLNIVVPFIIGSSVYGYIRLRDRLRGDTFVKSNLSIIVSTLILLFSIGNILIFYNTVVRFKYYVRNPYEAAFLKAKRMIPEDASLATINTFGAQLSHRRDIEFALPFNLHMYHYKKMGLKMYSDAEYQLFLTEGDTTSDPNIMRERIKDLLERNNYSVIFNEDEVLLLRKNK